jgi:hypothetical protein
MLARSIAIASLALGFNFASPHLADAMPAASAGDHKAALAKSPDGGGLQQAHGWWWAVPVVIGGVIILDHHHRYHRAYHHSRRCYRC